jgi:hypothetical protein
MNHSSPGKSIVRVSRVAIALMAASQNLRADITYVDASHGAAGNTHATGGSPANTGWLDATTNAASTNASQWILRTPLGADSSIYQALHSGNQIPELTTSLSGLADGDYSIWVFFWDGPNSNTWTISAGLSSGALTTYSFDGPGNTALPVAASTLAFTNPPPLLTEDPRILYAVKLGQATVTGGSPIPVYINNLAAGGSNTRTWYDGVGYEPASNNPGNEVPGPQVLGIDFNRNDALGAPSQSLFRIVGGSANQSSNTASYTKTIGARQVTISQPNSTPFEFRGANGDSSRAIPGGDTSLSYLVSDFIATREGAIDIEITNLSAGDYLFRSWHLDAITGTALGFAQGGSTTTPNTIEARIGGVLKDSVQPTALGSAGLNTNFIKDSQIPSIEFSFTHDGNSPLTIELRSTQSNGSANFLLLNGFKLYHLAP